jgi:hypothetical protein
MCGHTRTKHIWIQNKFNGVWGHVPAILPLRRLRQAYNLFESILGYIANVCPKV